MKNFPELKEKLSNEKSKPKGIRDNDLIQSLQGKIHEQKNVWNLEFRKRKAEKKKTEAKVLQSLWKKRSDAYKKVRAENKKEKEAEQRKKSKK